MAGQASADDALFARLDSNGDGRLVVAEAPEEHKRLFLRLLADADRDGSGDLTAEEFTRGIAPGAPAKPILSPETGEYRGANATRLLLLKLDTDGDTVLTRAEAPAELREAFDRVAGVSDRNADKRLTLGELSRSGPRLNRVAQQVARSQQWDVATQLARLEATEGASADRFERRFDPARTFSSPTESAALFSQLDADGDGFLVVDELPQAFQQQATRLLKRADRDRDDRVSEREFLAAAKLLGVVLKLQDRFRDGLPSTPENGTRGKPERDRELDRVVRTPRAAVRLGGRPAGDPGPRGDAARVAAERMIMRMDRNSDGAIAPAEARGRLRARFAEADRDGSGRIDGGEIEAIVDTLAERLRRADRNSAGRGE